MGKDFLDITPKAQSIKETIDKLGCNKVLKFCFLKTVKRLKRQETDWEKIYAKYVSDKGLVSRIYKESSILVKENNPVFFF